MRMEESRKGHLDLRSTLRFSSATDNAMADFTKTLECADTTSTYANVIVRAHTTEDSVLIGQILPCSGLGKCGVSQSLKVREVALVE